MKLQSELQELKDIIKNKKIRTMFQPIISLKNGEILGYEALSRGPEGSLLVNPQTLFAIAKENDLLFELEKICRENALYEAQKLDKKYKIFLNVDPFVIYDEDFRGGVTKDYLKKLSINQSNIVIELTEKTSIRDYEGFKNVLSHYRDQGYSVAIDDTGSGYSGLQSIVSISYNYIKIDRLLIKDINEDEVKQGLIEVFINFAPKMDSSVIAEGIETEAELKTLIDIGVDYGQGYFIARPKQNFQKQLAAVNNIRQQNSLKKIKKTNSIGCNISFNFKDEIVSPTTRTGKIVEIFEGNPQLESIVVIKDKKPVGLVMRDKVYYRLGTKFGYSVFMDRPIKLVMDDSPMIVDISTPISEVSSQAMQRQQSNIYDTIIVTKNDYYFGTVSIKDLLESFSRLQIEEAKQLNPLTNLPGNPAIEAEINQRIENNETFSVLYIDLDNFKLYNDQYGYKKGDEVIVFTATVLKKVVSNIGFIGHIGGDDFVVVANSDWDEKIAREIIDAFDNHIGDFFNEKDKKAGYMLGKDRQGKEFKSPLTSVSIAIVSNEERKITTHLQVTDIAAEVKKYAKEKPGSVFAKDRRSE